MYRAVDPRARCREAHDQAEASYRALVDIRGRVLPLVARAIQTGGAAPMIPDYVPLEPFPHALPDTMLASYTKRFEDLAAYYAGEHRRLAGFVEGATASLAAAHAPAPLGPAPRAVPFSYTLAETMAGYWVVLRWALFPPITMLCVMLFGVTSLLHPLASLALLVPLSGYAAVRAKNRLAVLREGEVADVLSRSVTFGASKMKNWPMTFTNGWHTEVRAYSGATRVTHFQYRTSAGTIGATSVSGVEYNGVLLCHPRDPSLAFGVPDFGSQPRPSASGGWDGALPLRTWAATLLAIAIVMVWIAASILVLVGDFTPILPH